MKEEKYKALKEYIKECKEDDFEVQEDYGRGFYLSSQHIIKSDEKALEICGDLNALLKEWFDKQSEWVTTGDINTDNA